MIKKLAKSLREFKKPAIIAPILMVCEVATEVFIPFLMAELIDSGINKGDMQVTIKYGILLLFMAFLCLAFGSISAIFGSRASAGLAKNLRHDMFSNIQKFSFSNIDKFSNSSLITRLTTDVSYVQQSFQLAMRLGVRAPIMLVLALIMSFRVNVQLSFIFLAAVPVLGIGLFLIIRHVFPIFDRVFKTYDKLNKNVQENLRGIRVVKSFVREEQQKEKFNEISTDIYNDFTKAEKIISLNNPLMYICMYACTLLIFWVGAKLVVGGTMMTGQLMSTITYASQILISLMLLSMVLVMIIISKTSAKRITEVLNETSDIETPENALTVIKNGDVTFENVSFSYAGKKDKLCLMDVNLDIKSGETIGIIGGTGTSKTTLVQLIPRLYDATIGKVLVGGKDVREYDLDALRNSVAFVLQKNTLFSGTIKENLRWGNPNATDEEMIHACQLAQADEFIQKFPDKYDTHIEQGGSNVSGGQRQRLCIARALLKKPKILILDDSTSAVDTKTDSQIRGAFRSEIPDTTKFIIAQRIASVQDADKIIVMDGGKVSAIGTHDELLDNSAIYSEVFYSQVKGADFDEERA